MSHDDHFIKDLHNCIGVWFSVYPDASSNGHRQSFATDVTKEDSQLCSQQQKCSEYYITIG
eukprot:2462796-Lingulodinium_polyedra.AAC.1